MKSFSLSSNLLVASFALCSLLVLSLSSTEAVPCSAQWQCQGVSTDYNFVECDEGVCRCRSELGFEGSATTSDKCRCDDRVYWEGGVPYCVNLPEAAATSAEEAHLERLKAKVRRVYTNLFPPTPMAILAGVVSVADLFAPESQGRVDPLGVYQGFRALTEYFYGFAANPTNYASGAHFVSLFGSGNEVFVRVDLTFTYYPLPGSEVPPPFNLTQSGRFRFNDQELIESADLIIHNLGKATEHQGTTAENTIQITCGIVASHPGWNGTCPEAMDPLGYYTDINDCFAFLHSIPPGTADRGASNSAWCRFYHALLTLFDPELHCPHAGKTGGHKCEDTPYPNYYLTSY